MSKEYIEREALFKKLHEVGGCDADTGTWAAGYDAAIDLVIDILKKEPAADVVEVVRCGQCKHITPVEGGLPLCTLHNAAVAYNDYCNYGERRADNG